MADLFGSWKIKSRSAPPVEQRKSLGQQPERPRLDVEAQALLEPSGAQDARGIVNEADRVQDSDLAFAHVPSPAPRIAPFPDGRAAQGDGVAFHDQVVG